MSEEDETFTLKFVRITKNALTPIKGSEKAAGYDLRRYVNIRSTTFHLEISPSCYIF